MPFTEYHRARLHFLLHKLQTGFEGLLKESGIKSSSQLGILLKYAESMYALVEALHVPLLQDNSVKLITALIDLKRHAHVTHPSTEITPILTCVEECKKVVLSAQSPEDLVLTYTLAVIIAAYNYSYEVMQSRVAALIVTKQHQQLFAGNPETGENSVQHAEVNAIRQTKIRGDPLDEATLFVSVQPCFREVKYKIQRETAVNKEESVVAIPVIVGDEEKEFSGIPKRVWKKSHGSPLWMEEFYRLEFYEVFTSEHESTVWYILDGASIPREERVYEKKNGKEYVVIKSGCAVSIALSGVKTVYYIHPCPQYKKGLDLLKIRGVLVHRIGLDDNITAICAIAHQGVKTGVRREQVVENMQEHFRELSRRLRVPDVRILIQQKFPQLNVY